MSNPSLLERVEAATGAFGAVEAAGIANSLSPWETNSDEWHLLVAALRGDLNTTLSLLQRVLPGWRAQFWQQRSGRWHCRLIRDAPYALVTTEDEERTRSGDDEIAGALVHPALALLAALLKAVEGEEAVKITVSVKRDIPVRYLEARVGVRYWEDAKVNGVDDDDGTLIPMRNERLWCPIIDLETGIVQDWPEGVVVETHYKVCDDGTYILRDAEMNEVTRIDGYVPTVMCPGGSGYGDYVIMKIDGEGRIEKWNADLRDFEEPQP
jgi:hypothetical protein